MEKNTSRNQEEVYGVKVRAGKRRTYFFDVKPTKQGDYYICITESKRKFDGDGFDRHKVYIYKEDFNKFLTGLEEAIDHVKTELLPDFDFDSFNNDYQPSDEITNSSESASTITASSIYDEDNMSTNNERKIESESNMDSSSGDGLDLDTAEEW